MSAPLITSYKAGYRKELEEIFFESSAKKAFKDEIEKQVFFEKYLGLYLDQYSQYVWVAVQEKVLGYCLGMPESRLDFLFQRQPHLLNFQAEMERYPAHLHINCHHEARGKGIGTSLVKVLLEQFQQEKIPGVHIITSTDSQNRAFYRKLGFDHEVLSSNLLFMGKGL